jgi:carotenoid cleavage dioxygenase-like enzyme
MSNLSTEAEIPSPVPFWLRSYFAPVGDEVTGEALPVIGEIPSALSGTYLRNGPNPRGVSAHWWFGEGMVHGLHLQAGQARWYRNRYVKAQEPASASPDESEVQVRARRLRRGGANTHVIEHAGRILALVESGLPSELDVRLGTLGIFDFEGQVDTPVTAHPKRCPLTGELHFFGYQPLPPYLTYYIADRSGRLRSRREVPVDGPSLMHDFAITANHALFFDSPARMIAAWGTGFPFQWDPGHATRVGVVPRAGGAPRWFPVETGHLGHSANAFERDGKIWLDGIRYLTLDGAPQLHRWELDLASGVARERSFDGRPVEFPRIDDRRAGLHNRYTYVVEPREVVDQVPQSAVLRKYDLSTGTSAVHDLGRLQVPSECVFVPSGADAPEDDGWLLTFVYDGTRGGSDLVVLYAGDLERPPVARIRLPQRVPFGFHGSWISRTEP